MYKRQKLQTASTYLADFHPVAFALIDLSAYRTLYLGKNQLKDEPVSYTHLDVYKRQSLDSALG